jgi:hypothetical protein
MKATKKERNKQDNNNTLAGMSSLWKRFYTDSGSLRINDILG